MRRRSNLIIIVAPRELLAAITRAASALGEVLAFESLAQLDEWRREQVSVDETIGPDVESALAEVGSVAVVGPLRVWFEAIATRTTTPVVQQLLQHWPSRRSFYRVWSAAIPLPPSAFLRRVRVLHAVRLQARGLPPKEAAHVAGFSSADQMRRARKTLS